MGEKQTRSDKVLEKDIQREILEWLDNQNEVLMFWRQNNGAVFGRNNAGKMTFRAKPKFSPNGVPDIWVIAKGKLIGLEVKRPGLSPSLEQKAFGLRLIRNGAYYHCVTSKDEAKMVVLKYI